MAKTKSRRRMGIAPQAIVLVLVLGLAAAMAIQPTRQLLAQRERIAGMKEELRGMQGSNHKLETRIARLTDPDYLEQRAREQIGLVRPGETTYLVMPPSKKANKTKPKRPAHKPVRVPPPDGFVERVLDFIGI